MSKGLTLSVVFQANSLNYGEGMGNISELKKLSRGNGQTYTYSSRQSLRYDVVRLGHEMFGWNLQTVSKGKEKNVIQFREDVDISDSEEMDLFGYMKTIKKDKENKGGAQTREAVARLTPAVSLEPFKSDMDFLSNAGFAARIGENNNLANIEQHISLYTYTITIDLERVGRDGEVEITQSEKAKRVKQVLEILNILNRNIRGRQENLAPLFVIGGIYELSNPFFLGRIKLLQSAEGYGISTELLNDGLEKRYFDRTVQSDTHLGMVHGFFSNEDQIKQLLPQEQTHSVQGLFDYLESEVGKYFEEK